MLYRKRSLLLLVCIIWRRSLPQTSWKTHGDYVTRREARARPSRSELTDLSCSVQVHDAEFMAVAIFLSIDRTRLFERARCSGLFCSDRARSLRAMHRLFVVQLFMALLDRAFAILTGMSNQAAAMVRSRVPKCPLRPLLKTFERDTQPSPYHTPQSTNFSLHNHTLLFR